MKIKNILINYFIFKSISFDLLILFLLIEALFHNNYLIKDSCPLLQKEFKIKIIIKLNIYIFYVSDIQNLIKQYLN